MCLLGSGELAVSKSISLVMMLVDLRLKALLFVLRNYFLVNRRVLSGSRRQPTKNTEKYQCPGHLTTKAPINSEAHRASGRRLPQQNHSKKKLSPNKNDKKPPNHWQSALRYNLHLHDLCMFATHASPSRQQTASQPHPHHHTALCQLLSSTAHGCPSPQQSISWCYVHDLEAQW